jgi:hypothetical protein
MVSLSENYEVNGFIRMEAVWTQKPLSI